MKRWLLDTSALLTLRDDEPGAARVADILGQARRGECACFGCFVSLMEVLYRVWKDEGKTEGRLAYEQCLSLPMSWVHESPELLIKAAEIKAQHRVSFANAWVAAAALSEGATLLHKDPEFGAVAVEQETLPFKRNS